MYVFLFGSGTNSGEWKQKVNAVAPSLQNPPWRLVASR
jgi:hypothetical protein